jgi:uroporphyrinogen decarboxylase
MLPVERVRAAVERRSTGAVGFWMGEPVPDTWERYRKEAGAATDEEIRRIVGDDVRWIRVRGEYLHPQGLPIFDPYRGVERRQHSHAEAGCFAEVDDVKVVDRHPWPDVRYLDYSAILATIREVGAQGYAAFTGWWSPFFHNVADYFGMENLFVGMYTHPAVVHAAVEHIVDFYVEANERLFAEGGDAVEFVFFANDFGTQRDCIMSPDLWAQFFLPGIRRLASGARKHGKKVLMHSCGSIVKLIPRIIEAGVEMLHPLQARAAGMDAKTLSQFRSELAFMGGIDTQELLVRGSPEDVRREVDRVYRLLGPNWIVSPSHEGLLPNVPFANVQAMAEGTGEINRRS